MYALYYKIMYTQARVSVGQFKCTESIVVLGLVNLGNDYKNWCDSISLSNCIFQLEENCFHERLAGIIIYSWAIIERDNCNKNKRFLRSLSCIYVNLWINLSNRNFYNNSVYYPSRYGPRSIISSIWFIYLCF